MPSALNAFCASLGSLSAVPSRVSMALVAVDASSTPTFAARKVAPRAPTSCPVNLYRLAVPPTRLAKFTMSPALASMLFARKLNESPRATT